MSKDYNKLDIPEGVVMTTATISAVYTHTMSMYSSLLIAEKDMRDESEVPFEQDSELVPGLTTSAMLTLISSVGTKMPSVVGNGIDDVERAIEKYITFERKLFLNVMEMFGITMDYNEFKRLMHHCAGWTHATGDMPDKDSLETIIRVHQIAIPKDFVELFTTNDELQVESAADFVKERFTLLLSKMSGAQVKMVDHTKVGADFVKRNGTATL